jgi:ribosome-associated protein
MARFFNFATLSAMRRYCTGRGRRRIISAPPHLSWSSPGGGNFERRCHIATETTAARGSQKEHEDQERTHGGSDDEQKQRQRYEAAECFAIDAARLASQTHCSNIVVLDVSAISPVTDFFVIATGTSPRQMRTVCDEVEELGEPRLFKALSRAGYEGDHWILVDFVDVVVHLFNGEARVFYDLENLWGDGKRIEWKDETTAAASS